MVTNDDSSGYDAYTGLQLASQERPLFYFRTLVCQSAENCGSLFFRDFYEMTEAALAEWVRDRI
jgi:hypothetical protein